VTKLPELPFLPSFPLEAFRFAKKKPSGRALRNFLTVDPRLPDRKI